MVVLPLITKLYVHNLEKQSSRKLFVLPSFIPFMTKQSIPQKLLLFWYIDANQIFITLLRSKSENPSIQKLHAMTNDANAKPLSDTDNRGWEMDIGTFDNFALGNAENDIRNSKNSAVSQKTER